MLLRFLTDKRYASHCPACGDPHVYDYKDLKVVDGKRLLVCRCGHEVQHSTKAIRLIPKLPPEDQVCGRCYKGWRTYSKHCPDCSHVLTPI